MQIGMIGLGRMGINMSRRLLKGGHEVVAFDRSKESIKEISGEGAKGTDSLRSLIRELKKPRIVWMMIPAGKPVDDTIEELKNLLEKGDILIDGGNSSYKDDIRRYKDLKDSDIHYLDIGVSGGVWGLKVGYCMMIGGEKKIFDHVEPLLKTLAPKEGYLYCGESGAGHYVKMVHNGIEYAMMEAYGEGFEILQASPYGKGLNYREVSHLWNQGSVIRSWLLELLEDAFDKDPQLSGIKGYVEDSGEGRWTVQEAIESGVSAPAITLSLFKRFQSRQSDIFSDKVLAALRNEFGGHITIKKGEKVDSSQAGAGKVSAARPEK